MVQIGINSFSMDVVLELLTHAPDGAFQIIPVDWKVKCRSLALKRECRVCRPLSQLSLPCINALIERTLQRWLPWKDVRFIVGRCRVASMKRCNRFETAVRELGCSSSFLLFLFIRHFKTAVSSLDSSVFTIFPKLRHLMLHFTFSKSEAILGSTLGGVNGNISA